METTFLDTEFNDEIIRILEITTDNESLSNLFDSSKLQPRPSLVVDPWTSTLRELQIFLAQCKLKSFWKIAKKYEPQIRRKITSLKDSGTMERNIFSKNEIHNLIEIYEKKVLDIEKIKKIISLLCDDNRLCSSGENQETSIEMASLYRSFFERNSCIANYSLAISYNTLQMVVSNTHEETREELRNILKDIQSDPGDMKHAIDKGNKKIKEIARLSGKIVDITEFDYESVRKVARDEQDQ